jgi:hypothetical protein
MTTVPTVARAAGPRDVITLQFANPTRLVTIPLAILLAVVAVASIVSRLVAVTAPGGGAVDTDANGSVLWSLLGFMVAVGVQAVAVAFPLALALGSTRRTFTAGVLLTAALEAALLTASALVLLGLELLTGGWFVGAHVLGDSTLGGGNALVLAAVMFLATLTAILAGAVFGAAWTRFGALGPLVLGAALAAAAVLALLLLAPSFSALGSAFEPWWLAVAALVVVAVSTAGTHVLLRRAAVR